MNKIIMLLAGGTIGALLRFLIAESTQNTAFPWSVLLINTGGYYFIGPLLEAHRQE